MSKENIFTNALNEVIGGMLSDAEGEQRNSGVYQYLSDELEGDKLSAFLDRLELFHSHLTHTAMTVLKDKGYKVSKEGYEMLIGLPSIQHNIHKEEDEKGGHMGVSDRTRKRVAEQFRPLFNLHISRTLNKKT